MLDSFKSRSDYDVWINWIKLKECQEKAKKEGGECLSMKFEKARIKLKFRCGKGHEFEMTPSNLKLGHWCRICVGTEKLTLEEFQEIARDKGGICLSTEIENFRTKLKFQCIEKHEFELRADVTKAGHWCRICARNEKRRLSLKKY